MTDDVRVEPERLTEFATAVMDQAGLERRHAQVVAESLVDANLSGVDTHGVFKLRDYVDRLQRGGMNPAPDIRVERTASATAVVDGDDGPGQPVTSRAMDTAVDIAGESGCGFVGVENSQHFGTAAYYTRAAADSGCIGFCTTHAGQNVVPYGGTEPYLGTNPIAVSLPREEEFHVTLDMATSVKAKSAVGLAEQRGDDIPAEWAIDEDGEPTTDPSECHALRPLGGHKGYGLAFVVEGLCGILMDAAFGDSVPSSYDGPGDPQELAHLVGAIDPDAFTDRAGYSDRLTQMIREVKDVPTNDREDEVLVPGEPEYRARCERRENGVPFSDEEWSALQSLAAEVGVTDVPDGRTG